MMDEGRSHARRVSFDYAVEANIDAQELDFHGVRPKLIDLLGSSRGGSEASHGGGLEASGGGERQR